MNMFSNIVKRSFGSAKSMKITRIQAYQVDLPLHDNGSYKWASGKSINVFDATVVRVITDGGRQYIDMIYNEHRIDLSWFRY